MKRNQLDADLLDTYTSASHTKKSKIIASKNQLPELISEEEFDQVIDIFYDDEKKTQLGCALLKAAADPLGKAEIENLVLQGADVDFADENGNRALTYAIGCDENVKTLLAVDADPAYANRKNETPLMLACLTKKNDSTVKHLLIKLFEKAGSKSAFIDNNFVGGPNYSDPLGKVTALHYACAAQNEVAIRLLTISGAKLTLNNEGRTPLDVLLGMKDGSKECVNSMLVINAIRNNNLSSHISKLSAPVLEFLEDKTKTLLAATLPKGEGLNKIMESFAENKEKLENITQLRKWKSELEIPKQHKNSVMALKLGITVGYSLPLLQKYCSKEQVEMISALRKDAESRPVEAISSSVANATATSINFAVERGSDLVKSGL